MSHPAKRQLKKIFITLVLLFGIIVIIWFMYNYNPQSPSPTQYGVTYSPEYAEKFSLDWKTTYIKVLDDLKVRLIRLPTYWDVGEQFQGEYDFDQTDWLISEGSKRGAKILLVVGYKQPRWPECHAPNWALNLSPDQRQEKVLTYTQQIIQRYKDNPNIYAWQVENEPLFGFGDDCDKLTTNFLQTEINLVKSLDSTREVVLTDTGEWSSWITLMKLSDTLGISVYYNAYNPILGYVAYPFPASFYRLKYQLVKKFFAPNNQSQIITELQTEPWAQQDLSEAPIDYQTQIFPVSTMEKSVNLAGKVGVNQIYLWGVEWWYFMASQGHPEYLDYVKGLFK